LHQPAGTNYLSRRFFFFFRNVRLAEGNPGGSNYRFGQFFSTGYDIFGMRHENMMWRNFSIPAAEKSNELIGVSDVMNAADVRLRHGLAKQLEALLKGTSKRESNSVRRPPLNATTSGRDQNASGAGGIPFLISSV
jgi:hypothetical protein